MALSLKTLFVVLAFLATTTVGALAQDDQSAAQANFLKADADSDTALTIDEFTRFIDLNADAKIGNARLIKRTGQYTRAFNRVDANKDGLATAEELSTAAGG